MTDYPYANILSNLEKFINGIPKRGVPEIVDREHLKKIGFTSGNDVPIISVISFIDLIDDQGKPTKDYEDFKIASKREETMSRCLKKAYSELFKLYPDAHARDTQELLDFFTPTTKSGELVVKRMVSTFLTLCEFSTMKPPQKVKVATVKKTVSKKRTTKKKEVVSARPTEQKTPLWDVSKQPQVVVNIQLVIPESNDPSLYEELFKALKKHLLE